MNSTCNLTGAIQTWNRLTIATDDGGIDIDLKSTHAIVNNWCDNCHIEWLSQDLRSRDKVVVELFATSSLATSFVMAFATRICWPFPTLRVCLLLLGSLIMIIVSVDKNLAINAHVLCEICTTGIELHHPTASVM